MKTGLSALRHVRSTLLGSAALAKIIDKKIYYVAAIMGVTKPYITCTRTAIVAQYTKDGWMQDDVIVAVDIVAESYEQAVEVAEIVREVLEDSAGNYNDFRVVECEMTRSSEGYSVDADAFVITMDVSISIS